MNNVVSFDAAVRGHSGRSLAYPSKTLSYDDAWRLQRVERLLCVLRDHIHCPHCLDELVVRIIERGDGLTGLERLARRVVRETRQ